jgi:hypothetical protein
MAHPPRRPPGPGAGRSDPPLAACESYAIMTPANGEKDKT